MLLFLMQCAPSSLNQLLGGGGCQQQILFQQPVFKLLDSSIFEMSSLMLRTGHAQSCALKINIFFFMNDIHDRFFTQLLLIIKHNFSAFRKQTEP